MIKQLLRLLVAVVLVLVIGMFLRWAMTELGAPHMVEVVVWIIFGLIVLIGVANLLGYDSTWWNSTP